MAHYLGDPASSAMLGFGSVLSVVAAAGPCLSEGLQAVISDINQACNDTRYNDALSRAVHHGRQLRTVAEVAISRVNELEEEVASLRAACAQRQEVIRMLQGRS